MSDQAIGSWRKGLNQGVVRVFRTKISVAFFLLLMFCSVMWFTSDTNAQAGVDERQNWENTETGKFFRSEYIPRLIEALRTKDSEYLEQALFHERSRFPVRIGYRGHKEVWVETPDELYDIFVNEALFESFSSGLRIALEFGRHTAYEDNPLAYSPDKQVGLYFFLPDFAPRMFQNATIPVPSFNCDLAKTKTEKVICSDVKLAKLDYLMGESYAKAKNYTVGAVKKELVESQRSFLSERDQCGTEFECLRAVMIEQGRKIQSKLEYQLENYDFSVFTPRHFGALLNGHWLTNGHISSNAGSKASLDELRARHSMSIYINWPYANVIWFFDDEVIFEERCEFDSYENSLALAAKENSRPGWGSLGGSLDVFGIGGHYALIDFSSESLGRCFTLAISGEEEIQSAHVLMTGYGPDEVYTGGSLDQALSRGADSEILTFPESAELLELQ